MKKTKKTIVKKTKNVVKKIVAKAHKPAPKITPVKPQPKAEPPVPMVTDIDEFKDQLELMQVDLTDIVRKKKEEVVIPDAEVGDEADVAVRSLERDLSFETAGTELRLLEEVEAALRRIEKKIYGRCEACMQPVAEARLRAMPYARYCVKCQARFEHF
jgi:DnaK suppressor protein